MDFSSFDKLEDLVKSYKDRRGGLCCRLVSNFVDPPDDYGPVIDYEDLFWDLSSESIVLGPKLGEGSFGTESVNYEIYANICIKVLASRTVYFDDRWFISRCTVHFNLTHILTL